MKKPLINDLTKSFSDLSAKTSFSPSLTPKGLASDSELSSGGKVINQWILKERGNHLLRFIDRTIGIPLVLLASLRFKRKLPKRIESIAILKSAGIGDLVFMSGVIQDIRKAHPVAKIWLFTGKANAGIGKLIEGVELVVLPMTNPIKAAKIIRGYPVDLWIDADPWPRISTLLTLCSRSKFHVGFNAPKQWRHFPYDATASRLPTNWSTTRRTSCARLLSATKMASSVSITTTLSNPIVETSRLFA